MIGFSSRLVAPLLHALPLHELPWDVWLHLPLFPCCALFLAGSRILRFPPSILSSCLVPCRKCIPICNWSLPRCRKAGISWTLLWPSWPSSVHFLDPHHWPLVLVPLPLLPLPGKPCLGTEGSLSLAEPVSRPRIIYSQLLHDGCACPFYKSRLR